ncbi:hypothetical protein quinque_005651 [Culex quinquefasciatus]
MAKTKMTMRVSSSKQQLRLPTEVLERIFLKLPFVELLTVRAACSEFRKIVDECLKLRARFRLKFPLDIKTMDKNFHPQSLIPASGVIFEHLNIVNVGAWWPRIAGDITEVTMNVCDFPLDMLRFVPNLEELNLDGVKLTKPVYSAFKLGKIKRLSVKHGSVEILECLDQIIPKPLVKFEFAVDVEMGYEDQQKVIQFVSFRQDTLEELSLKPVEGMLERISRLNEAKLKRVTIGNFQNSPRSGEMHLIRFARGQSTIEELTILYVAIRSSTIREMGRGLPRLKRFVLHLNLVDKNVLEAATKSMPMLEYLEVKGPFTVTGCDGESENKHLKELVLRNCEVSADNLKKFLQYTPFLTRLTLEYVKFDDWSDFTELMSGLYSLEYLRLHIVSVRNHDDYDAQEHVNKSVKYVELDGNGNLSTWEVSMMFLMFPELKELRCSSLEMLNLHVIVKELGIMGKTVGNLVLRNCKVSQAVVQNIVEYCAELQRLQIEGDTELTGVELGRFRAYMKEAGKEFVET